jgi:outer membrane lipoprotein SlyB
MMNKIMILTAVAAFGIAGCANVGPLPTASGNPETVIPRKDPAHVKNELMTIMSSRGFEITADGQNTIAFTKPIDGSWAMLYKASFSQSL